MADKKMLRNSARPSDIIDIDKLKKVTRNFLFIGLLFAFITHPVLGSYFMFEKNDEMAAQSYSIKFVLRAARLTKTFELKPKHNSHRVLQKQNIAVKQPVPEIQTKTDTTIDVKDSIENLDVDTEIVPIKEKSTDAEQGKEITMPGSVETGRQVSMKNEMISVDDHDTGQFKVMVVQKPYKQDIHGFVYLSTTWGTQLRVPDPLKSSVINLAEAVNRYTNIEAKVGPHLFLNSRELFNTPFVYITTDSAFELTPIERKNFGDYLRAGGFAVIDNGDPNQEYGQAESSLRQMIRDTLGTGIKFAPIPNDYPLYHCFFDFHDGPPQGSEINLVNTMTSGAPGETARNKSMAKTVRYLEGIWLDGRLAVVYSNKGYSCKWKDFDNNEPQLKMGVNMVVYALIQEDGIAQKIMSNYSSVQ